MSKWKPNAEVDTSDLRVICPTCLVAMSVVFFREKKRTGKAYLDECHECRRYRRRDRGGRR